MGDVGVGVIWSGFWGEGCLILPVCCLKMGRNGRIGVVGVWWVMGYNLIVLYCYVVESSCDVLGVAAGCVVLPEFLGDYGAGGGVVAVCDNACGGVGDLPIGEGLP